MKLIINSDNGRLSLVPELADHIQRIRFDRNGPTSSWLDSLREQTEPFVFFLHCEAEDALNHFRDIVVDGEWPTHLQGVVIFNSAKFAGLSNHECVRHEMNIRGLSALPIHVSRSAIYDHRPQDVVDRVVRLVQALQHGGSFLGSLRHLDPPEVPDIALSLWALNSLLHLPGQLPCGTPLKSYVLENLCHDAVAEFARALDVPALPDSELNLTNLLNACSLNFPSWPSELLCDDCSVRQNIRHSLQKPSAAVEKGANHIAQYVQLHAQSSHTDRQLAHRIARSLPIDDSAALIPFIRQIVDAIHAKGCHFLSGSGVEQRIATITEAHAAKVDLTTAMPMLLNALQCEVHRFLTGGDCPLLSEFEAQNVTPSTFAGFSS